MILIVEKKDINCFKKNQDITSQKSMKASGPQL